MQDLGIRVLFMGNNFIRLLGGLWVTIRLSLVSILLSVLLGILLGVVMTFKNPVTKCLSRVYLEFIRIMPQLVLLFLVYFGAAKHLGVNMSGEGAAVFSVLRRNQSIRAQSFRGNIRSYRIYPVGNRGDGRSGAWCAHLDPEASV